MTNTCPLTSPTSTSTTSPRPQHRNRLIDRIRQAQVLREVIERAQRSTPSVTPVPAKIAAASAPVPSPPPMITARPDKAPAAARKADSIFAGGIRLTSALTPARANASRRASASTPATTVPDFSLRMTCSGARRSAELDQPRDSGAVWTRIMLIGLGGGALRPDWLRAD